MARNKERDNRTFKETYEQKVQIKMINECSWFGIISGLIFITLGTYYSLCTVGFIYYFFKLVFYIGYFFVILGGFAPFVLKKLVVIYKSLLSFAGGYLLKALLIPVYALMCLINFFMRKKYEIKFGFNQWDNTGIVDSYFEDCNETNINKGKYATWDIVNNVLLFFINKKMYVLVPIVIILLVLGIVIFFASSNAVFSFVYTLF